jgi:DNA primase
VRGLDIKAQFPAVLAEAQRVADDLLGASPSESEPRPRSHQPISDESFDALARAMISAAPLDTAPYTRDYLGRRRLLDQAKDDGWGGLPTGTAGVARVVERTVKAVGMTAWTRSGMADSDGGLKFARHGVLIPWRDETGRIVTVQQRATDSSEPRYVCPTSRGPRLPYGTERLAEAKGAAEVAFVEGAFDVLALRALCRRRGRERVVLGVPGVSGWRKEWATLAEGRVVHVALDADEAGERAAVRIAKDLHDAGASRVLRTRPHRAKDWADLLDRGAR